MTAPNIAEKVCRGTPSQSAQLPYSVLSSMRVSPTSKNTARTASALAAIRSGTPGSRQGELLVQVEDGPMILPGICGLAELDQAVVSCCVAGGAEQLRCVAGLGAGVDEVAVLQVNSGKISEEHSALLNSGRR